MMVSDLIKHHKEGAEACRAYAGTPSASEPKAKDIAKRYEKKAKWHEEAVSLLEGMVGSCETREGKERKKGRKPIPLTAPTPPPPLAPLSPPNKETSRPLYFQRCPEGEEPDPDNWEMFGHATIKPIPASSL